MKRKKLSEKPFADPRVIAKSVCFAEPEDIAVHVSRYLRDRWGLQEPKKPTKVILLCSCILFLTFAFLIRRQKFQFFPFDFAPTFINITIINMSASWIKMTRFAPGIPNEFDLSNVMFYPDQQDITSYACKHNYT